MTVDTIPVAFANKQGLRLFGILHLPDQSKARGTAILLLSPGVKMRVAPHRLYKKMADRFAALGYPVLRFDFHGLGDSEGEVQEALLADLYGTIQVGRYVDDTIAAMDYLQRSYGISKFVASGLCGGAITGLLTAQRDARIVSLLALAIPAILDGSRIDAAKYITAGQLEGIRQRYLQKLRLSDANVWRSWKRFLTFQSDYRLLAKSLMKPVRARFQSSQPTPPAASAPQVQDNTNPYFAPALLRMLSTSRRVLFIFAGSDRLHWEFDAKFFNRHRASLERYAPWYDIHITQHANHVFSLPEWQRDMLDRCCRWLPSATN